MSEAAQPTNGSGHACHCGKQTKHIQVAASNRSDWRFLLLTCEDGHVVSADCGRLGAWSGVTEVPRDSVPLKLLVQLEGKLKPQGRVDRVRAILV